MSNAEFNRLTNRLGQLFSLLGDGFPQRPDDREEMRSIQAQLRGAFPSRGIQSIHID